MTGCGSPTILLPLLFLLSKWSKPFIISKDSPCATCSMLFFLGFTQFFHQIPPSPPNHHYGKELQRYHFRWTVDEGGPVGGTRAHHGDDLAVRSPKLKELNILTICLAAVCGDFFSNNCRKSLQLLPYDVWSWKAVFISRIVIYFEIQQGIANLQYTFWFSQQPNKNPKFHTDLVVKFTHCSL